MLQITKGVIPMAKKVVIYGPEGIGKSTFASMFPDAVFIDTEGSTASMDVARVAPQTWTELLTAVKEITAGNIDIPCKTLVIDTADWAETLCAESVCASHHWDSLSASGYGTGYRVNWEEYGKLLNELSNAIPKGINVVITAHAAMRKFEQPDEQGSYDRWELKLQNSPKANIAAMVKEWADMVLFANYKTIVSDKDKQGKGKARGGRRVMYTEHHPCWDAKNRYGLPAMTDFTYDAIRPIIEGATAPEIAMPKPTAPAPKVELAKKTHYFVTGDKFWKVEKGQPVPTQDALAGAREIARREFDAKSVLGDKPKPEPKQEPKRVDASPNLTQFAAEQVAKQKAQRAAADENAAMAAAESGESKRKFPIDSAIPEKVQRLMRAKNVDEWDIQNVVSSKGYFPYDMPVKNYPSDFVDGWLIPYFDKVADMAREIREKQEIPFK